MKEILFVTGNDQKAAEVQAMIDLPITRISLDIPEIQSLDVLEIATQKARKAYELVQKTVLIEDVSLVFTAMGALPGPLIKWFLKTIGPEGLCKMLDGYSDRSARAEVCYVLYDGTNEWVFRGEMKGGIAHSLKDKNAHGWSGVFIPEGEQRTWSEMSLEEKKPFSMRFTALSKLKAHLER